MEMDCILIRHGRTAGNDAKRYSGGRTDEDLTPEGSRAIADCTDILSSGKAGTVLFTSPMKRAVRTAQLMFPGIGTHELEDLREMDFGVFEGRTHEELDGDDVYQAWIDSVGTMKIPEGESLESFRDRTMRGFRKAASEAAASDADTLVIVAHGGTVMAVMSSLFDRQYYEYYVMNGEGYRFRLEVDDEGNVTAAGPHDSFCGRVHP